MHITARHRLLVRSVLAALTSLTGLAVAAQQAGVDTPPVGAPPPQTVVVTASRHAMLAVDAPASLSVVNRRDIEARGADNVLDAVRAEPGISLQGRAVGGRKVIALRGLDSRHTLFLVDGRRIGASDGVIGASDFQYDWIASDDIDRIEVVRGPLSVLYGSEALGGVVNIITRRPGQTWRLGSSVEGSQAAGRRGGEGHRLALQADGSLTAELGLRAGAAHSRVEALASPVDTRLSELEGRDKRDAWLQLAWQAAAGHRVDLAHRQGHELRDAGARERGGARRYHQTVNEIERSMTSLDWLADWAAPADAEDLSSELRTYRATIAADNRRSAGVATNPAQHIQDDVVEGQVRWPWGRHAGVAGFELRESTLADPGLPGGAADSRHRALFLQNEFGMATALRLTAGLRFDSHSRFGHELSPRVYLVWRASPGWTFKGGYGHGFSAPNLKQIVPGTRAEGPNLFVGNPALGPETSDSVEWAAGWSQGPMQAQLTLFEQRVRDLIDIRLLSAGAAPGTGTYTYESLTRARMRGLESSWLQPLGAGFGMQLSYAYLDARNGTGQRLDRRPRHTASLRLEWNGGPWQAGLEAEFSGGQTLPTATATAMGATAQAVPDITLLGAHVVRTLPAGLTLTVGVHNLTDLRLAERSPLFTQVERPRSWRVALRGRW